MLVDFPTIYMKLIREDRALDIDQKSAAVSTV